MEELLKLKARGVYIQDGPEYYESVTGKIPLESLRLSWLLFSPGLSCAHGPANLQTTVFVRSRLAWPFC